jgi:hypothetical protein
LPRYSIGEELVLFLRNESRRGFTSPVGLGQGAYHVTRHQGSAQVRSDLAPNSPRSLDEFIAEIARLTGQIR